MKVKQNEERDEYVPNEKQNKNTEKNPKWNEDK